MWVGKWYVYYIKLIEVNVLLIVINIVVFRLEVLFMFFIIKKLGYFYFINLDFKLKGNIYYLGKLFI